MGTPYSPVVPVEERNSKLVAPVAPSLLPSWESLSLKQQIAQMVVVRASGYLFDHQIQYPQWEAPGVVLQHLIQDLGVGGVILLGGSAPEVALRTQQLQEWATIPLFMAADVEEGVGQRFPGGTWFPPPMALAPILQANPAQACEYATQMGTVIARESLAIGLNWVLAPVVDVNNNPGNPVINVRAFGETPEAVGHLITAFLTGAQAYPVLTSAKHFPGHGDTAVDSHLELPVLPHSADRLAQLELTPFAAAIAAGVDTVMSAHLQIPAWDTNHPATLSHPILTGQLRQHLQFDGLIVTDALVMGAITQRYGAAEAAVLAVEAGADILLMPLDPEAAITAVCEAVESGRIPQERIEAALERIWRAKFKVVGASMPESAQSPHAWEQVTPPLTAHPQSLTTTLAQPDATALVQKILQEGLRVYQPVISRLYPPPLTHSAQNLILVDRLAGSPFLSLQAPAVTIPQEWGYRLQWVDQYTPNGLPDDLLQNSEPTLLQIFVRGNPFRGSAGLTQTLQAWVRSLVKQESLQALILYGSPYMLETLLEDLPPDVPYIFTYGQMPVAQTIALQTLLGDGQQRILQEFTD
ncbi:MAG: glycoside hydrolase family 3 N-terminal domain-containing protein [Leptolyngbyaceae cyanobacterium bins.59]|nr:glycoside hydrolase family 3 N-terminal domain-containing protein [Leptolyngbyaceae cyanobacterium bins.59]